MAATIKGHRLKHGHAIVAKFFPEAKGLLTQFEEALIERLYGLGKTTYPIVFDDQYPSTGGQFMSFFPDDRMTLDLRPLAFRVLVTKDVSLPTPMIFAHRSEEAVPF